MPRLAVALTNIQDAINATANAAGVDSTQHLSTPDPPQSIQVSAGSDHAHVTLTDASQRNRARNYFVEYSANDPSFGQPHVEHLGASRGRVLALPAKDGNGATIKYYFRGYSHSLGAESASAIVTHGGTTPTPVQLSGSSQLALLPSTGSGTATTLGKQGGTGFGTAQYSDLPPNAPKAP